jgi:hypothetical protein
VAGLFSLGYSYDSNYIDWWKLYEMTSGFIAGALYAIGAYWVQNEVDKAFPIENISKKSANSAQNATNAVIGVVSTLETPSETQTKLLPNLIRPPQKIELMKNLSLMFSIFFLLAIVCYGASYRAGIFLGLYSKLDDQYSFPIPRIILFVPIASCFLLILFYQMRSHWIQARTPTYSRFQYPRSHSLLLSLLLFLNFIGILTIWTTTGEDSANSKIGIFYSLFIWMTIMNFFYIWKDNGVGAN